MRGEDGNRLWVKHRRGQVEMRAHDLNSKAALKRWLKNPHTHTQIPPMILTIKLEELRQHYKGKTACVTSNPVASLVKNQG